jgi:predicted enzyme related to lactoylglutathione lyase
MNICLEDGFSILERNGVIMARVVHFEIQAEDPERAVRFYSDVFGWQANKWAGPEDYWLLKTGPENEPGIDGAILRRPAPINGDSVIAFVCTIDSHSIDTDIASVTGHGGTIVLPKMAVPHIGWLVYCKDTEGNIFGIMQADPNAA